MSLLSVMFSSCDMRTIFLSSLSSSSLSATNHFQLLEQTRSRRKITGEIKMKIQKWRDKTRQKDREGNANKITIKNVKKNEWNNKISRAEGKRNKRKNKWKASTCRVGQYIFVMLINKWASQRQKMNHWTSGKKLNK